MNNAQIERLYAESIANVEAQIASLQSPVLKSMLTNVAMLRDGKLGNLDLNPMFERFEKGEMAQANAVAKAMRSDWYKYAGQETPSARGLMGDEAYKASALAKSTLDVGYLTDLSQLAGGQALGLVSMDTRVMRGTVRPNSFTLYNVLKKTRANQMVDFWTVAASIGGNLPGSAYIATANQTNSVSPNNGTYQNEYCTLKMLVDGRAMTVALAAQSSFIDIAEQESANAAMNLLSTMNWSVYWGNPTLYSTQPNGIANQIPASNIFDFSSLYASSGGSLSQQQFLYNTVYEVAAFVVGKQFGLTTHVFSTPATLADMQGLVTARLDQFITNPGNASSPIVINGDFQGMRTRFGAMQFPVDLFIDFRDRPAASFVNQITGVSIVNSAINAPTSVAGVVNAAVAGSDFTAAYAGSYTYAVAAADSTMFETALTFSAAVTGVAAGDSVTLTITPNGASAAAFRVFRSGLGYAGNNASAFRLVGEVAANGATPVTFTDLNTKIPGSQTLFLLDLDDMHDALDYRWLLPITKVDLFTSGLYMPWAVTHIGTPRVKMPKWHAMIKNYVPANPTFNPLAPNSNAQPQYTL